MNELEKIISWKDMSLETKTKLTHIFGYMGVKSGQLSGKTDLLYLKCGCLLYTSPSPRD